MDRSPQASIRFDAVHKSFGDQVVLHDFSLDVPAGAMRVILGGSGSGKSTVLKLVLGLTRPDSGQILIDGVDITRLKEEDLMPLRARMGMVFQEGALFDSLSVADNVAYRMRESGHSPEAVRASVAEALGYVDLSEAIDKFPAELSGGMRKRVAIARAIIGEPEIMLYDEPTAGLDPITGRTICELVMQLRDIEGSTSIFVTHDLNAAHALAREQAWADSDGTVHFRDRNGQPGSTTFVMLADGRIIFEGSIEELERTQDAYIREFLE